MSALIFAMIHKFNMFGNSIVLDVESGCIFLVDDLTYKILDFVDFEKKDENLKELFLKFPKEKKGEIEKRFEELFCLYEKDVLFSKSDYEKFGEIAQKSVIKAMCLHVAHDCNLRCKYCFASTGDFNQGRMLMSFETAKTAIDFLVEKSENRKNLEVDFFGGEPLLNFEVVKKTIDYAKSLEKKYNKNFRFTITTNGVLLDSQKIDYINKNMSNVVLSLDGRKEINDNFRVTTNKAGSYDLILPKFKEFVEKRKDKDYYIRGTFTRFNLDFFEDVLHFYEQGFNNISVEPVVCEEEKEYSIRKEDLPKIFKEYEKLAEFIITEKRKGSKINFFHFNIDLKQGPCLIKRLRGCGCGCEYLAISPEGDVYPCHQFVGEKRWLMGNIYKKNFDENLKDKFSKINLLNKEECQNCWAKYYCSGGCNANNHKYAKNLLKPYFLTCEMERKRVECSIAIKADLLKNNMKSNAKIKEKISN